MRVKFYRNGRLFEDEYTVEEISALDSKAEHPERNICCPRCGKDLIFEQKDASYTVFCATENCLYGCCRGI